MEIRDVQNRVDKFLKYSEPLQKDLDYRFKILIYTLGEVMRHDVYDLFYGANNPIKSSFKVFCADVVIQVLIYLRLKGVDLSEVIELGLDKVTRDKEYEVKLFRK